MELRNLQPIHQTEFSKVKRKGKYEDVKTEIVPKDTFTTTIKKEEIKSNAEIEPVKKIAEMAPDLREDKISEAINKIKSGGLTDGEMENLAEILIQKMY